VPFVNRSILRDRLSVLRSDNTMKRILVVNGPRFSGKSYSRELIDHLCGAAGKLLHCLVALQPGQETSTGAAEIARDLVAQIGRPPGGLPPATTNEDRWARDVATWVLSEAVSTTFDWWIVLDGFDHPDVRQDARKFIVHLADQINRGVFARRCRLILLSFDRTSLSVTPGKILAEEIDGNLDAEVAACVREILDRTQSTADAAQVSESILAGLPAGEQRLPALNRKLSDLLEVAGISHG